MINEPLQILLRQSDMARRPWCMPPLCSIQWAMQRRRRLRDSWPFATLALVRPQSTAYGADTFVKAFHLAFNISESLRLALFF